MTLGPETTAFWPKLILPVIFALLKKVGKQYENCRLMAAIVFICDTKERAPPPSPMIPEVTPPKVPPFWWPHPMRVLESLKDPMVILSDARSPYVKDRSP